MTIICAAISMRAQVTFSGNTYDVVSEQAEAATGLDRIYVVYDTRGVTASYTAQSASKVVWMRYRNLGGGYAEEVVTRRDGDTYTIDLGTGDMGYIIEEGTRRFYCWVVNYANHQLRLESLSPADEQDCDRTRLELTGNADRITYYTINGSARELSRGLSVEYRTLRFDADAMSYNEVDASVTFASIDHTFGVPAPLCDTHFTVRGDRFLSQWGMEQTVESAVYHTIAVEAQTRAEQTVRDNENEQKVDASQLGGSAPAEVVFTAAVTDAAIFREWQLSTDAEFETVLDRFQQLEFTYTFRDNGNYYVRFVANNAAGTCEYAGETYEVFIGESDLVCPNAFSPNDDGVNDEWRVSYKSIVQFECHIFNRWGQEMCSFTDPAQGWDGRYGGRYVPTGTYYYVIKALGSDGRKYNLSGDINIIHSRRRPAAGASDE